MFVFLFIHRFSRSQGLQTKEKKKEVVRKKRARDDGKGSFVLFFFFVEVFGRTLANTRTSLSRSIPFLLFSTILNLASIRKDWGGGIFINILASVHKLFMHRKAELGPDMRLLKVQTLEFVTKSELVGQESGTDFYVFQSVFLSAYLYASV